MFECQYRAPALSSFLDDRRRLGPAAPRLKLLHGPNLDEVNPRAPLAARRARRTIVRPPIPMGSIPSKL